MTKKQAYKIIEERYGDYTDDEYIHALCLSTPPELKEDWCEYWYKINTEHHLMVRPAVSYEIEDRNVLVSLTRLMLLHDFIEDTYD